MESQVNSAGSTQVVRAGKPGADARASTFEEVRAFLVSLLEGQCELVGASGGVVVLVGTSARAGGLAARHATDDRVLQDPAVLGRLERLGARAIEARQASPDAPGAWEPATLSGGGLYESGATHVILAVPLVAEGRVEGACVLVIPAARKVDPDDALGRLALTSARFEAFLWRRQCMAEAEQRTKLRETLELLDTAMQGADAEAMGALMCHELARRFGCTRVAIGLIVRDRVRLTALSAADAMNRKGAAVEAIEQAMEECADQDAEIVYPAPPEQEADPGERRITRAHEQLSERFGPSSLVSFPLRVEGGLVGVVLLERDAHDPFPAALAPLLRLASEFIGPAIWTRRQADRGILRVSRDRLGDFGRALVGPRHTGKKLIALLCLCALAVSLIPFPGRIGADGAVRAGTSRTIAPPYAGFLGEVFVRPGDHVDKGEVLAVMDTSELALSRAELAATLDRLRTQRDAAQAQGAFADVRLAEAQIAETMARIEKLDAYMADARIRAPIEGVVSRGDLESVVGARVDTTQPLFEIVAGDLVVVLEVDERDIADVRAGTGELPASHGWFAPRATPGVRHEIEIVRINPVGVPGEGANVYLVEAVFTGDPELSPGSSGRAHLAHGWTTILNNVVGPLVDELRLRFWW